MKQKAAARRDGGRQVFITERRLFGPMTCRIGGCGNDATCLVSFPAVQYWDDGPRDVRVGVWMCRDHGERECQKRCKKRRADR